jgi:hypothetical protein
MHVLPFSMPIGLRPVGRDFQGVAAMEEDPDQGIFLSDYINIMSRSGWKITHIIDCPMSSQRFKPGQADAEKPNPRGRSTLPDCRKKKLIKIKLGVNNEK